MAEDRQEPQPAAHGGSLAVAAARAHGVSTMFTLSGGHVFPLYDGAVKADPPMRLVDVRHEQTAVFAAEATARLTRAPGLAVLTAGPGVTNGVSAVTTAHFNGSPVVVLGGRAPDYRWGSGSLQETRPPRAARAGHQAGLDGARGRPGRLPRWMRRSGWPPPRTGARSSWTSRWRHCSARRGRAGRRTRPGAGPERPTGRRTSPDRAVGSPDRGPDRRRQPSRSGARLGRVDRRR